MLGFDRVTFDLKIMGGKAHIRGMRITVSLIYESHCQQHDPGGDPKSLPLS